MTWVCGNYFDHSASVRTAIFILLMSLLAIKPGHAVDQRSHYYPERLTWRPVKTLHLPEQTIDARFMVTSDNNTSHIELTSPAAQFFIHSGQADFVRFSTAQSVKKLPVDIWSSRGDGLFIQVAPTKARRIKNRHQWILPLPDAQSRLLLVKIKKDLPSAILAIEQGKITTPTLPDYLQIIPSSDDSHVLIEKTDELQQDNFYRQPAQVTVEGPAYLAFEFTLPWQDRWGMKDTVALSISSSATESQQSVTQHQVYPINPDTRQRYDDNEGENRLYARRQKLLYLLPSGTFNLSVTADKPLLGRWFNLNTEQTYLFSANSENTPKRHYVTTPTLLRNKRLPVDPLLLINHSDPLKKAPAETEQQWLLQNIQQTEARTFYRTLYPTNRANSTSLHVSQTRYQPDGHHPPRHTPQPLFTESAKPFFKALPNTTLSWHPPAHNQRPPLRMQLQPDKHDVQFSLATDKEETHTFLWLPKTRVLSDLIMLSGQQDDRLPAPVAVASANVQFNSEIKTLTLTTTGPLSLNLSAKEFALPVSSAEQFIRYTRQAIGEQSLTLQMLLSDNEFHDTDLPELNLEFYQWTQRFNQRANQFLLNSMSEQTGNTVSDHEQIYQAFLRRLRASTGINDPSLNQINLHFEQLGLLTDWRRILRGLALLSVASPLQQEAEQLLTEDLTQRQRWQDLEGLAVLKARQQPDDKWLLLIARSLFRQQSWQEAARWYWLIQQFSPEALQADDQHQAIFAAVLSKQYPLVIRWLNEAPDAIKQHWGCWLTTPEGCYPHDFLDSQLIWHALDQPMSELSKRLLYNQSRDKILTQWHIRQDSPAVIHTQGKRQLRLQLLSLLPSGQSWPSTSWLTLKVNQTTRRYYLGEFRPSDNLRLLNDSTIKVSTQKTIFVELPEGTTSITLIPDNTNLLATVSHAVTPAILLQPVSRSLTASTSASTDQKKSPDSLRAYLRYAYPANQKNNVQQKESHTKQTHQPNIQPSVPHHLSPFIQQTLRSGTSDKQWLKQQLDAHLDMTNADEHQFAALSLHMLYLLSTYQTPQQLTSLDNDIINLFNAVAAKSSPDASTRQVLRKINRFSDWLPLETLVSSAGHTFVPQDSWQPQSATATLNTALTTSTIKPGQFRLVAHQRRVINLTTTQPKTVYVALQHMTSLTRPSPPRHIIIGHNEKTITTTLSSGSTTRIKLPLTAGQSRITLQQTANDSGMVFYQLLDTEGNSVLPAAKRRYHAASNRYPLKFFAPANTWLRISTLTKDSSGLSPGSQGQDQQDVRFISKAQTITLWPDNNQQQTLYRIHHWRPKEFNYAQQQIQSFHSETAARDWPDEKPRMVASWLSPKTPTYTSYEHYLPDNQDPGTHGFFLEQRRRNNNDEDETTSTEVFTEAGWNYRRRFNSLDSWWRSDIALRRHDDNNLKTLLSEQYWLWRRSNYHQLSFNMNHYYQWTANAPTTEQPGQTQDTENSTAGEWSMFASATSRWTWYSDNNLRHRINLTGFMRALSLSELSDGQAIDDDIFSTYKAEHRQGWRLSHELIYLPWADSQFKSRLSTTTNNFSDITSLDNYSARLSWAQFYRDAAIEAGWRWRYFKADEDREANQTRTNLFASLQWHLWETHGELWQLRAGFDRDTTNRRNSFSLSLSWNDTNGTGYDDFAPTQINFYHLRVPRSFQQIIANQLMEN